MPAQPLEPTPQQVAQMKEAFAAEAQKRGLTPQEFAAQQRAQLAADAQKRGMTVEQFVNFLKQQALQQRQQSMALGQQHPQAPAPNANPVTKQIPIVPGNPKPEAIALAKWLKGQNLKPRSCILNGDRKELFKVKRALRALHSDAYKKASLKPNSLLPPVNSDADAENVFKLLPMSLLALRVSKIDPTAVQPGQKPHKHVKGLWTVKIEQQQDVKPEMHYIWLFEGSQWKTRLIGIAVLTAIMAVILFPLWPYKLRLGVWYISMGFLILLGLFFAMAIVRLILFIITYFAVPPGLWLYPNLFEDVGFFDSFRPVWGWHGVKEEKKRVKKGKKTVRISEPSNKAVSTAVHTPTAARRDMKASVEDAEEE